MRDSSATRGHNCVKKYRLLLGSVSTVQTDLRLKEKRVRIAQKLPLKTHLRKRDANFPGRAVNIPRAGTPPQDPPPESHYWVKEEAFFRPAPKPLIGQRPQQSGKQHGKRLEEKKVVGLKSDPSVFCRCVVFSAERKKNSQSASGETGKTAERVSVQAGRQDSGASRIR